MRISLRLLFWAILIGLGWIGGAKYGAPAFVLSTFDKGVELAGDGISRLLGRGADAAREGAKKAADAASDALEDSEKEDGDEEQKDKEEKRDRKDEEREQRSARAPAAEPAPEPRSRGSAARSFGSFTPDAELYLCPRMTVSNAPRANADRLVSSYRPVISVGGVPIITAPVTDACLASGFGDRDGKLHKGVDYNQDPGGPVVAAGGGVVLEAEYRDDYGNYVLIAHGSGVHTRYAHLVNFAGGVRAGARVSAGQRLGIMGNTAGYPIPVHLHYEILTGDYENPKGAFGLEPVDPFSQPAAR
ncbi:MAG: M23 family metallopeptidase [Pseudomonadota bacterium]